MKIKSKYIEKESIQSTLITAHALGIIKKNYAFHKQCIRPLHCKQLNMMYGSWSLNLTLFFFLLYLNTCITQP